MHTYTHTGFINLWQQKAGLDRYTHSGSTRMGNRLRESIPPRYVTKPTRSTQPCIPPGLLNRVPALTSCGKGRHVTSAGWQVTLCDPIWHVSSHSGEAVCELLYSALPFFTFIHRKHCKSIQKALQMQRDREMHHKYKISHLKRIAIPERRAEKYITFKCNCCYQIGRIRVSLPVSGLSLQHLYVAPFPRYYHFF